VSLDDLTREGIERFARSFNHRDPSRWFDVDWLSGFAMLIRRSALDAVGGFDESIRTGDGEDHKRACPDRRGTSAAALS